MVLKCFGDSMLDSPAATLRGVELRDGALEHIGFFVD